MAEHLTPVEYLRSIASIFVFFVAFLIGTPIVMMLVILSFGKATNFCIRYIGPAMVKPVLWTAGVDFKVKNHGFGFEQPVIYIINHSSTLDLVTMIALGLPRIRFVAKWELQYNPLFFLIGRATGQVFIKRQATAHAVETLQKTYKRVKNHNLSIMLAPEGSRKHPGIIGPFKKGAFRMAMDLDYPIVPIFFENSRELSLGSSMLTQTGEVVAHIHEPLDTSGWSLETLDDHIAEVRGMYLQWAGVTDNSGDGAINN